ncbi:uncharacterized protein LOC131531357 [Onychostoma macrolepis]|uniref:uncharacterized protein LOC131531357 n=1 Tax=Onychostoma macrolepis TaxID=369639 RepID=UPI00272CDC6B|nr:uncharacterized protein LOC131531357 [Onychostoma macrolepis]XP_058618050.1 uncharacterized protein LOC131531357 [Onychostoma macrolepis]XP_058618051.1 uncharacterized protein LOC131531357 [Onychostoma macrolepis]
MWRLLVSFLSLQAGAASLTLMDQKLHSFSEGKTGASGFGSDKVSVCVKEGDPVTLHTGVKTNQQEAIQWYFKSTRIAQISGDLSFICTDVQCNEGTERFKHRLKLDHQTGSLTIMNIRTTDSGEYILEIINSKYSEKIFSVSVTDSCPSSGDVAEIVVFFLLEAAAAVAGIIIVMFLLLVAAAVVVYCRHRSRTAVPPNEDDDNTT